VIFTTDHDSRHGHPEPLRCPAGVARQSMALYYFTAERSPVVRSTRYRARPGDRLRAVPIYLDTKAVQIYDWAKRRRVLSDARMSALLRRIERVRRRPGS
jgi:hypothetical protein